MLSSTVTAVIFPISQIWTLTSHCPHQASHRYLKGFMQLHTCLHLLTDFLHMAAHPTFASGTLTLCFLYRFVTLYLLRCLPLSTVTHWHLPTTHSLIFISSGFYLFGGQFNTWITWITAETSLLKNLYLVYVCFKLCDVPRNWVGHWKNQKKQN